MCAALSYNHLLGYLHCIMPNSLMGWNLLETWLRQWVVPNQCT